MRSKNIISKFLNASVGLLAALLLITCTKVEDPIPIPDPLPPTYTINGEVLNNLTGAPIAGVSVLASGLSELTTDSQGKFQLLNLKNAGKYVIYLSKDGFLPTSVSIEFPEGEPNKTYIYSITAKMVPYVPGGSSVDPVTGGSVVVEGTGSKTTVDIQPNTTVKDATGAVIQTVYQISAIEINDITSGTANNPPLKVFNFLPDGYTFSPPIALKLENPLSEYYFTDLILQYYKNNQWETQATPVTFNTAKNEYVTSISHFSSYKIAIDVPVVQGASYQGKIKVYDSLKVNQTINTLSITEWKYASNSGIVYEQPLEAVVAGLGITGSNQQTIVSTLKSIVTYYNSGVSPSNQFTVSDVIHTEKRDIPSQTYMVVKGNQTFNKTTYSVKIRKTDGTNEKTIVFSTIHAGAVVLEFDLKPIEGHDHGHGGGGTV